jgi:HAD domain in Swiss Army Knife RNA repair proteins
MSSRVLLLDFDGVLHPGPGIVSPLPLWCWLPDLTRLLAPYPDVHIVVHSTWRLEYGVDELRMLLEGIGERVIDSTPPGGRLESIERWLEGRRDVKSYCILDDNESDFFDPLPAELILCPPARGISDKRAQQQLLAWLSGQAK